MLAGPAKSTGDCMNFVLYRTSWCWHFRYILYRLSLYAERQPRSLSTMLKMFQRIMSIYVLLFAISYTVGKH